MKEKADIPLFQGRKVGGRDKSSGVLLSPQLRHRL